MGGGRARVCFRRSSQHLFSHSFVRASLNMHGVWSRAGASGTPQTAQAAQAGPSRYDGAQLSSFALLPPHPTPPPSSSAPPTQTRFPRAPPAFVSFCSDLACPVRSARSPPLCSPLRLSSTCVPVARVCLC